MAASNSVLGLYDNPDAGANAMDGLQSAGFALGTFDVLTGTPYPEGAFGEHVPQHRLFRFPFFGALVGLTLARALKGKIERHRAIARWTWPIWLYVSIAGLVVYLFLYQLYPAGPA